MSNASLSRRPSDKKGKVESISPTDSSKSK